MGLFRLIAKDFWNRLSGNVDITAVIKYSVVRGYRKVRRNEPCPCGSGKKFKECHIDTSKGKYGFRKQGKGVLPGIYAFLIIIVTIFLVWIIFRLVTNF